MADTPKIRMVTIVKSVVSVVLIERVMVCQMLRSMTSSKGVSPLILRFSRTRSNTTMVALIE